MKTSDLTINGKTWRLAFDFNAIVDAEQASGCNLLSALERLNDLSATQLRGLLYAAIVIDPPARGPSLVEVGELIRLDTIMPVTEALATAYQLSMREEPAEEKQELASAN